MPEGHRTEALDAQMHWLLLTFLDPLTEARYAHFAYVTSGFYGGKLWHMSAILINIAFYIWYHGYNQGFTTEMFVGQYWIGLLVTLIVSVVNCIGLFVEPLFAYRETLFLVTLLTHWPAYTVTAFFGMGKPWALRWVFVIGCFFFCAFLVQARFSRVIFFLVVSPLVTLTVAAIVIPEYWNGLSYLELWFWTFVIIPPLALRVFEREVRRAFLTMEASEAEILRINGKIEKTQTMIVSFFAKTPTRDFLTDGRETTRTRQYVDTAMIVTDIVGFTAWTSKTPPAVVVRMLSEMFATIDSHCTDLHVEKVTTVGDSFQGAIFPSEAEPPTVRVFRALHFSTLILPAASGLQMRIGVHMGRVVAAFIGNTPPRFDLFGDDFEEAKQLESSGIPGKVHISAAMVSSITGSIELLGETPTEMGVAFTDVCLRDDVKAADMNAVVGDDEFSAAEISAICKALMTLSSDVQVRPARKRGGSRLRHRGSTLSARRGSTTSSRYSAGRAAPMIQVTEPSNANFDTSEEMVPLKETSEHSGSAGGGAAVVTVGGGALVPTVPDETASMGSAAHTYDDGDEQASMMEMSQNAPPSIAQSSMQSDFLLGTENEIVLKKFPLEFEDPANETLFQQFLLSTGLVRKSNFFVVVLEIAFLLAYVLLGCMNNERNRLIAFFMLLLIFSYLLLMSANVNIPRWTMVTLSTFAIIAILSAFVDSKCDVPGADFYTTNIIGALVQNCVIATNFMLDNKLIHRIILITTFCVLGQILLTIRVLVFDDPMGWDPAFGMELVSHLFVSYFSDYTMRVSFAADRRLQLVLRRARGKFHANTVAAMNTMVPTFVSDRLIEEAEDREYENAHGGIDDAVEVSGAAQDQVLLSRSEHSQTWEFPSVTVAFIAITPRGDALNERITSTNKVMGQLEHILRQHDIQKIKTIGTTLMCVAGINDERDHVGATVQAVMDMTTRVLRTEALAFSVGLHSGSCFGAVMGTTSILFDVFGDTVNLASRMCSTANPNSAQVSPAVRQACLDGKLGFRFETNDPVFVKGKGDIQTHNLCL